MKFWDSSAIVGLLVQETFSERVTPLAAADRLLSVWWGTKVECASAICRLEREGRLDLVGTSEALRGLEELSDSWMEIDPSPFLRDTAMRMLRVHNLRAGDALQLAAALATAENHPGTLEFVCLDTRLAAAATREGFRVVG